MTKPPKLTGVRTVTETDARTLVDLIEHVAMLASAQSLRSPTGPDIDRMEDAKAMIVAIMKNVPTLELTSLGARHVGPGVKSLKRVRP